MPWRPLGEVKAGWADLEQRKRDNDNVSLVTFLLSHTACVRKRLCLTCPNEWPDLDSGEKLARSQNVGKGAQTKSGATEKDTEKSLMVESREWNLCVLYNVVHDWQHFVPSGKKATEEVSIKRPSEGKVFSECQKVFNRFDAASMIH